MVFARSPCWQLLAMSTTIGTFPMMRRLTVEQTWDITLRVSLCVHSVSGWEGGLSFDKLAETLFPRHDDRVRIEFVL